jgi:hypothetical protein
MLVQLLRRRQPRSSKRGRLLLDASDVTWNAIGDIHLFDAVVNRAGTSQRVRASFVISGRNSKRKVGFALKGIEPVHVIAQYHEFHPVQASQ